MTSPMTGSLQLKFPYTSKFVPPAVPFYVRCVSRAVGDGGGEGWGATLSALQTRQRCVRAQGCNTCTAASSNSSSLTNLAAGPGVGVGLVAGHEVGGVGRKLDEELGVCMHACQGIGYTHACA